MFIYILNKYIRVNLKKAVVLGVVSSIIFCVITIKAVPEKWYNNFREGVDSRTQILKCTGKMLNQNPFFGIGPFEQQSKLNECYSQFKTDGKNYFKTNELNTHNFYAFILLSGGIFLFFFFIYKWYNSFYIAFKTEDTIYICFLILMIGVLFIENYFERMYGILFFNLFNSLWFTEKWKG